MMLAMRNVRSAHCSSDKNDFKSWSSETLSPVSCFCETVELACETADGFLTGADGFATGVEAFRGAVEGLRAWAAGESLLFPCCDGCFGGSFGGFLGADDAADGSLGFPC